MLSARIVVHRRRGFYLWYAAAALSRIVLYCPALRYFAVIRGCEVERAGFLVKLRQVETEFTENLQKVADDGQRSRAKGTDDMKQDADKR